VTLLTGALGALGALPPGAHLGAALPGALLRQSLVQSLTELGQFDDGISDGPEAVRSAELAGHPFSLSQACRSLASLYLRQGRLAAALPLLERAQGLCAAPPGPQSLRGRPPV
jgi:hypothetical protein